MDIDVRDCPLAPIGLIEICILIEPMELEKADWMRLRGDPAYFSKKDKLIIALIDYGPLKYPMKFAEEGGGS